MEYCNELENLQLQVQKYKKITKQMDEKFSFHMKWLLMRVIHTKTLLDVNPIKWTRAIKVNFVFQI
jgi:hypothetical protein